MTIVGQTFEGLAQHRQFSRQVNHLCFVKPKNTMPEKEAALPDPLVFIPGLNCTAALFGPQAEALVSRHSIVHADVTRDPTIAAMARRVLETAPERFAVAGLSMGGYVAFEIMRQAPQRVTRIALLDTSARPDTEEAASYRRIAARLWDKLQGAGAAAAGPRIVVE